MIPGLVNAHIHLELTRTSILPPAPTRLDLWIHSLLQALEKTGEKRSRAAVAEGIRQCLRSGTTTVGEIETLGISSVLLRRSPLRARVFRELIGLDPAKAPSLLRRAKQFAHQKPLRHLRYGVSPHAPYSTSEELLRNLAAWSRREKICFAMHLAESPGEIEMIQEGRGALMGMLSKKGKIPSSWVAPRVRPFDWIQSLGLLSSRFTLIHGNLLRDREMEKVVQRNGSVVYCPGSHAYFRYEKYPLEKMLRKGVRVALGTDSLASNRSLDMFREMASIRKNHPSVSPRQIFTMATAAGAGALGWQDAAGCLKPGKEADFLMIPTPNSMSGDGLMDFLTSAKPKPSAVFISGKRVI